MNPRTSDPVTVLMVDDTPANLHVLVDYLDHTGYSLIVATNGTQAIERCQDKQPDLILLDVLMPGIDGFETCRRLKANPKTRDIPVIFMTALSDPSHKVQGFEAGGIDYITKPMEHAEVLARIETHLKLHRLQQELEEVNKSLEERVQVRTRELHSALEEIQELKHELEQENRSLRQELTHRQQFGDIIGVSPAIQNVTQKIEMVSPTDANVLILGPSGVGKELVAREIHKRSERRNGPMVKVNCASIPRELYESEFFGHAKGSFTGAIQSRMGRFAAAHNGTLFLDEVGEIPLELQSKLLRVLQEGTYERVGEERTRTADVRIVAATNRDLYQEVAEGRFRADLYYRLNVFPVQVPSLHERRQDIPLLAQYFLERNASAFGVSKMPALTEAQARRLQEYTWPGNIRELQNVIEQALIQLRFSGKLSFQLSHRGDPTSPQAQHTTVATTGEVLTEEQMKAFEKANLERALDQTNGRIRGDRGAANLLGIKPTTLASRIKSMGITRR